MPSPKNKSPLVSVLITTYNGLPYIKKAIDGILAQTYLNIEVIIVDDHSTDGTDIFLNGLASAESRINFFLNPVKGRGTALNYGLSKCNGSYVAINDADDFSTPERIQKQVEFLEENQDYGLVGSMSELISLETGEVINRSVNRPVSNEAIRKFFLFGQPIQHVTVMFRTELIKSLGGYNEKINFLFDRDLFLRVAKVSKVRNLEEVLVLVGEHNNRFFKYQYRGIHRAWVSTKYQLKAIFLLRFSPIWVVYVVSKFLYSIFLNIVQFFRRHE